MIDNANGNKYIKFRVTDEQMETIQKNARACGKTVSGYVRDLAVDMVVIDIDHAIVSKHTDVISACKNSIFDVLYGIKKQDGYTPAEIEFVLQKVKMIDRTEAAFLEEYSSFIGDLKKTIAKTVRSEIRKKMTSIDQIKGEGLK